MRIVTLLLNQQVFIIYLLCVAPNELENEKLLSNLCFVS